MLLDLATTHLPCTQPRNALAPFVRTLLSQDLPLLLAHDPSATAISKATGSASAGRQPPDQSQQRAPGQAPELPCQPLSFAQLRRIWVVAPSGDAPLFASRPVVELRQTGPVPLPAEALEALVQDQQYVSAMVAPTSQREQEESCQKLPAHGAAHHSLTASVSSGSAGVSMTTTGATAQHERVFRVSPEHEVKLPPGNLSVISLPAAWALPMPWVALGSDSCAGVPAASKVEPTVLCPVTPIRDDWPWQGRVLGGTIMFPCRKP